MATTYTGIIQGNQEQVDKACGLLRETIEKAMRGEFHPAADVEGRTNHTYLGLLSQILDCMDVEWKVEA